MSRPLRILHLPVDLGGHARALAAAQRQMGHEARAVSLVYSPLGFNGDECLASSGGTCGRLANREIGRFRLLWQSLFWADVVHCHFGQSCLSVRSLPLPDARRQGKLAETLIVGYARLLWLKDLTLWRLAGKRIAMTFYGDDIRLNRVALKREPWSHHGLPTIRAAQESLDDLKLALIGRLAEAGAQMFVTNPDLLAVLPPSAAFLPYGHVDPAAYSDRPPRVDGPLRFVHMPTDRNVKGTVFFLEAIAQLKREGFDIELTLVENRANSQALAILADHDVLLDQLRVGWFGGVAIEAMAMGKPVVAHINLADLALTPPDYAAALPIIPCSPDIVVDVLRRLASMPRGELRALGARSRAFVVDRHAPENAAKLTLAAYFPVVAQIS